MPRRHGLWPPVVPRRPAPRAAGANGASQDLSQAPNHPHCAMCWDISCGARARKSVSGLREANRDLSGCPPTTCGCRFGRRRRSVVSRLRCGPQPAFVAGALPGRAWSGPQRLLPELAAWGTGWPAARRNVQPERGTAKMQSRQLRPGGAARRGCLTCQAAMPSNRAAVPPSIAIRSSSVSPGVLSTRSTSVLVHGNG